MKMSLRNNYSKKNPKRNLETSPKQDSETPERNLETNSNNSKQVSKHNSKNHQHLHSKYFKNLIRTLITLFFTLFIVLIVIYIFTGFFNSYADIDSKDLAYWNYTSDGTICNTDSITINGSKDTCWLMLHSYAASPYELNQLAINISLTFGDYVVVPRLKGNGEVPSHIVNLSLEDWFNQVDSEYNNLTLSCGKINVLGSSYGGTLTLRLAEEYSNDTHLKNIFIVNGFLGIPSKWYYGLTPDEYLDILGSHIKYFKKFDKAQVNDEVGLRNHITYWSLPAITAKNSLPFIVLTRNNFSQIKNPLLILHSHNDMTADYKWADKLYSESKSQVKEIHYYDDSNHVLLLDYNRSQVIDKIIDFEISHRNQS